jgi:hypothetical protein
MVITGRRSIPGTLTDVRTTVRAQFLRTIQTLSVAAKTIQAR